MSRSFFAMVSRMKYITRWALMRNTVSENISEHSHEVACIAHALAVLGNKRLGKKYNCERAALLGLYHDMPEILTGDMPTPVKYFSSGTKEAYKAVENAACEKIMTMLPEDIKEEFSPMFFKREEDKELWRLVKAADKISAFIKCIEEEKAGNREFVSAKAATEEAIRNLQLPEANIFVSEFMPSFELTLDQQE